MREMYCTRELYKRKKCTFWCWCGTLCVVVLLEGDR